MPFSNAVQNAQLKKLNEFRQTLPTGIGEFAERVRPDSLHCEINAWQNTLDILYHEAVVRNLFHKFIETLSAAVGSEISNISHCNDSADTEKAVNLDLNSGVLHEHSCKSRVLSTDNDGSPEGVV